MKQSDSKTTTYVLAAQEPLTVSYLVSLIRDVRPHYLLVKVIEGAEEAIRYYTSCDANLMIYDLGMPDTREVNQICGMLDNKPVIFISDYDSVADCLPSTMVGRVLLNPVCRKDIHQTFLELEQIQQKQPNKTN